QHPEALAELCALQARILNSAARCVAAGGRLVYATCSLLAEENEDQVRQFLATHPDFELIDGAALLDNRCPDLHLEGPYVQLRPDVHGTDGFFAAVFERKKNAVPAKPPADTTQVSLVQETSLAEEVPVATETAVPVEPAGASEAAAPAPDGKPGESA
ncbi:MAG TPA: RsmB/NOP family class I SAM-dependent RNA methyltransferase, partial [Bordetella sp.]|nr:RsmB/NOP family class I SAM-dependent RNA methyltransferase [Bordetella sp.]